MKNTLFEVSQLLKLLSEEMDIIELERMKIQQLEREWSFLKEVNEQLLHDLEATWKNGEMHAFIQETTADVRTHGQSMQDVIECQKQLLMQNMSLLEEKETGLIYKRSVTNKDQEQGGLRE